MDHIADDALSHIFDFWGGTDIFKKKEMIRNGSLVSKKFSKRLLDSLRMTPVKYIIKDDFQRYNPSMALWMVKHRVRIGSFVCPVRFRRDMLVLHILEHCDLSALRHLDITIGCGSPRKMYPVAEEKFPKDFVKQMEDMPEQEIYPYLTNILTRNKTCLRELTIRGYPRVTYGEESLLEMVSSTLESLEFGLVMKESRDSSVFFNLFEQMSRLNKIKISGYQSTKYRLVSKTVEELDIGNAQVEEVKCPCLKTLTIGLQPNSLSVMDIARDHPQLEALNFEMTSYREDVTTRLLEGVCNDLSETISKSLSNLQRLRIHLNVQAEGDLDGFIPSLKIDSKSIKHIELVSGNFSVEKINCPALKSIQFCGPYKDDDDESMDDEDEDMNMRDTSRLIKVAMTPVVPPISGESGPYALATEDNVGENEFVGLDVPKSCSLTIKHKA
jgi:hypothetical protein